MKKSKIFLYNESPISELRIIAILNYKKNQKNLKLKNKNLILKNLNKKTEKNIKKPNSPKNN